MYICYNQYFNIFYLVVQQESYELVKLKRLSLKIVIIIFAMEENALLFFIIVFYLVIPIFQKELRDTLSFQVLKPVEH